MRDEILLVAGTRPEAVKLAPVAVALHEHPSLRARLVHTGQHEEHVLGQALAPFGIKPDEHVDIPRANGSQAELFAALVPRLDGLLTEHQPAAVVVQGDTASAFAGALAAFWRRIPLVHLEAGLRTHDLDAPFPEEANRQMISRVAALHLAPTARAADALRTESVPDSRITVVGNTVVDAVRAIAASELPISSPELADLQHQLDDSRSRLLLVTVHRRESWGAGLGRVLDAVHRIVAAHPGLRVLVPAHPNPAVREQVETALADEPRVCVTAPLDYPDLVWALRRSALVVTDSGGIQEEAPSFGVPVLVTRESTERVEAVEAGCAQLVGTDTARIVAAASDILAEDATRAMSNPYGDGEAAERCVRAIGELL